MANYTKVITDSGISLLNQVVNSSGTLELIEVRAGDGAIGASDPTLLQDMTSLQQTFTTLDIRTDSLGNPYIYFITDNEGLVAGYLRREVGVFARMAGSTNPAELLLYLYAPTDDDADFIPVPTDGIASIQTFRVQIAEARGLSVTLNMDHSTVFLALDRWADHLTGAGGPDQHAVASSSAAGLMSAADKVLMDAHIDPADPSSGTTVHANATPTVPGFLSAADKTKLDGIAAGAEVNQNSFAVVKVGSTNVVADAKSDVLEIAGSTYIAVSGDAVNDKVTISAQNITPSSHIGSNGSAHAVATTVVNGFMSAADKTKLNGIATGAEVNQNAFSNVKVGASTIAADAKTDTLELAAGSNVSITPDVAGDKATFALALPYYAVRVCFGSLTVADLATFDSNANTTNCGMWASPKGGLTWTGSRDIPYTACLEMRINNTSAAAVTRTLKIASIDDDAYYQIDNGAAVNIPGSQNVTFDITIPAGVHTIRFFIRNTSGSGHMLQIGDWLDSTVVWAAGGRYY